MTATTGSRVTIGDVCLLLAYTLVAAARPSISVRRRDDRLLEDEGPQIHRILSHQQDAPRSDMYYAHLSIEPPQQASVMGKLKLKRPTLKTAHEFHRAGIYPPGHDGQYLTDEEHDRGLVSIEEDLHSIVRLQFPKTQKLEYAILKAHLIVEHAIGQYIRACANVVLDVKSMRFSFSQKLDIAHLMGFGAHSPTLIPTVELLNRARNQVAHSFDIDRSIVDELLRINAEDYDTYRPKNDRERIRGLKLMCALVTGFICGYARAHYSFERKRR
jgi:hypothetical protein